MPGRRIAQGLLLALLVASACSEEPAREYPASDEPEPAREELTSDEPQPRREYLASDELQPLTADEVHEILESGEGPVVIDVRPPRAHARGHIPGTVNHHSKRIQDRFPELRQYADRGIVVYCDNGLNSKRAGLKMLRDGFPKVFFLKGYFPEWERRGYPVEVSEPR